MRSDRTAQVKRHLEAINPTGGLDTLTAEPSVLAGVADAWWASDDQKAQAVEAVELVEHGRPHSPEHTDMLEAVILPVNRPVVDVRDGSFAAPIAPFTHFGEPEIRPRLEAALPGVGRIDLPDHPSVPFAGTGFLVGPRRLMTNRHVADLFATGAGTEELAFRPGQQPEVDFLREVDRDAELRFRIARVRMIHPFWDMALLEVDGLDTIDPLRLSVAEPGDLRDREIAVLGYPAWDPRGNPALQHEIFGGRFDVKRMQPGMLREVVSVTSYSHAVPAIAHDSSTLGGNSGSALVDAGTGEVVGLHFGGRYLEANWAVPTFELARDARVVAEGLSFAGAVAAVSDGGWWAAADPVGRPAPAAAMTEAPLSGEVRLTVPLDITVRIGEPAPAPSATDLERVPEAEYATRRGYDEDFLGLGVPFPAPRDERVVARTDDGSPVLRYQHFSIVMHAGRRLALVTGANVDAAPARKEPEPGRGYDREDFGGEDWFLDPRIAKTAQLPDRFFTKDRGAFDRGHVVRREDVSFGDTYEEVRRANVDSYHSTNCSPQVAGFNQSSRRGRWGQLENLVLAQAETERYCVFAGPVLLDTDPVFAGVDQAGAARVRIPRSFWKVVVARHGDALATFAFVLEQDLSDVELEFAVPEAWVEHMISVRDLEALVGLVVFPPELHGSDRIDAGDGEAVRAAAAIDRRG